MIKLGCLLKKSVFGLLVLLIVNVVVYGQEYSITFASFKDAQKAEKSYDELQKLFKGMIKPEQLHIQKTNSYNVIKLENISTQSLKNELVEKAKNFYPDLIVRRTNESSAASTQKTKTDVTLVKSIMLYENKKYKEAYNILSQLEAEGLESEEFFFYLGRTTFELGMYSESVASFESLLAINPTHGRARLEKARAHFFLKEYALAKKEFQSVLILPLPESVRKNVENYIEKAERSQQKNFFSGMLYVGVGRDTNVYNNTFLGTTEYGSLTLLNNTDKKGGSLKRVILALEHAYRFEEYRGLEWKNSVMFYNNKYDDFEDQNILLLSFKSGPQYISGAYKTSFPITYDWIQYGGKEYLKVLGTAPSLEMILNTVSALKTTVRFHKKSYAQPSDRDKDSKFLELKLEYNHLLFGDNVLSLKGSLSGERKDKGNRTDISKNSYDLSASYLLPLSSSVKANATAGFTQSFYLDTYTVLGKRSDYNSYYILGLNKQFNSHFTLGVNYTYSQNTSNINSYSYKKSVYLANAILAF